MWVYVQLRIALPEEVGYFGALRPLGVSVVFVLMLIMMVIVHVVLKFIRTTMGRGDLRYRNE
jgi:hypothetical protein